MRNALLLAAVCFVSFVAAGPAARAADAAPPSPAAEFPIGFWCGPPDKFVTPERFAEIRDAGFTHVFPPCSGGPTVEANKRRLELAAKVGLKVFVADGRIPVEMGAGAKEKLDAVVADYGKYPALAGYFVADEPGPSAFPALAAVVAHLREKDPAHPGYINVLPNHAPEWAIGKNYDEYVDKYIEIVKPFAVSYDHYHFTKTGDGRRFFKNLDAVRRITLKHDVPFWNIVLLIDHGPYRKLTEPELRFEAMQTLAYGGRGLMFFTYWQPPPGGEGWAWGQAVINLDGTRTPHYEHVKAVNRDVQAIGRHLVNARSLAVDQAKAPKDIPVAVDADTCTLGFFAGAGERRYVLLTSRDYKAARDVELTFRDGVTRPVSRLDKSAGEWVATPAKSSVKLAPGDGALFRW